MHFADVLTIGDEFREDRAFDSIQEKFRQALTQRSGDDEFRGRDAGSNGAQPGVEGVPDESGEGDGEVLEQPLADDAGLNEDVVAWSLRLTSLRYLSDARWRC